MNEPLCWADYLTEKELAQLQPIDFGDPFEWYVLGDILEILKPNKELIKKFLMMQPDLLQVLDEDVVLINEDGVAGIMLECCNDKRCDRFRYDLLMKMCGSEKKIVDAVLRLVEEE